MLHANIRVIQYSNLAANTAEANQSMWSHLLSCLMNDNFAGQ